MKYKECPYCGCALDFGEKCDCREEEKKEVKENEHRANAGTAIRNRYSMELFARKAI